MRDWLKNVLITLYERDEDNNLLTEKQKLKVGHRARVWELTPTVEASTSRMTCGIEPWSPFPC